VSATEQGDGDAAQQVDAPQFELPATVFGQRKELVAMHQEDGEQPVDRHLRPLPCAAPRWFAAQDNSHKWLDAAFGCSLYASLPMSPDRDEDCSNMVAFPAAIDGLTFRVEARHIREDCQTGLLCRVNQDNRLFRYLRSVSVGRERAGFVARILESRAFGVAFPGGSCCPFFPGVSMFRVESSMKPVPV